MERALAPRTEPDEASHEAPSRPLTAHLTPRIARGDEGAFASFYELWFDRAFALARRTCRRDESFCLDIVQDAMMRVVKSMPGLETEAAVEAFMGRVVLTTAIDRLRADTRRRKRERNAAKDELEHAGQEHAAEATEQLAWLHGTIAELPDRDRKLLESRFRDGHTLAQAGASVGLSGNAAHSRIRRLVQSLRDAARGLFHD